ncbi:hypothetical protein M569_05643, partial [Genlisea aurea]
GYIEPVIVILHELELTWAGRVSSKHHTCMISALSISTTLKQYPLIWSATNLPHDAYKLLAVPSPIGGVLVIGANTIHYHSQSASCILALNNFAVPVDSSQEMLRSGISIELDAANATWLTNDVVMFSTKSGELLLLNLIFDGRTVQRLDVTKSRASVLTSDITTIGNSLFFLGSRLGDSLLVQYNYGGPAVFPGIKEEVGDIESDEPLSKRLRTSSDALQDIVPVDELSFYSTGGISGQLSQKAFKFAVRDSLLNIGPLKDFSYGLRANVDANATGIAKQSNYELVSCSGHGKNGALTLLQRSIRPEMISQVSLPGCKGIWTVYHKNSRSDLTKSIADEDEYHAYLIISLESRTMVVLQTAANLEEVTENVEYYVQGSTISAGNLFGRRRVIQVYSHGVRILDGAYMCQDLSFELAGSEGPFATSVSIADPYVLIRMTDGSVRFLIGDPSTCSVSISTPPVFESPNMLVSACTLYHDFGPEPWFRKARSDAWLSAGIGDAIDGSDGMTHDMGDVYCIICYENGNLDIFDVPSFNRIFSVHKFISGRSHIFDTSIDLRMSDSLNHKKSQPEDSGHGRKESTLDINVVELSMLRWKQKYSRPFLFGVLSDGSIYCYHAYIYEVPETASKLEGVNSQSSSKIGGVSTSRLWNLRFIRVRLDGCGRESLSGTVSQRIFIFNNVGGLQGLLLSGSIPAWIMMFRERLRIHPQVCDGPIVAFAVLHNINCSHGFIYITSEGSLKICQLPALLSYDNYWPVQKTPLKATPHQISYFSEKNLYPLIVSNTVLKPINQIMSSLVDQEVANPFDHDSLNSDGTYPIEEFEVRIMEQERASRAWKSVATISMQSSEHALTVRVVTLANSTTQGNDTLLAIGTAYVQGEDVAGRGRLLLYSVERNPDNIQTKVSEVFSKELKGAISALSSLQGHLLIAAGPKIILHKWTGSELNPIAFFDAPPLHAVSLNTVRNYILLGDIHRSIYFLNWKEQSSQLNLMAKDFSSVNCLASEFLIDGSTLGLFVSDDQKNVQMFYYAPKMSESWKGQKLLSRAEFHIGSYVTKFLRLQLLPTPSDKTVVAAAASSDKTNRFGLLFGTLDGSLGCIAPVEELTFRRLQSLQKKLVDVVAHVGGLNPRSFRRFRSEGKAHRPGPDGILDMELLSHYEMLGVEEQVEVAQQIGTTRTQIISNLNAFALSTSFL